MDMNTIEEVLRTTDPADFRDGDAWLAGGTVLFSYGSYAFGAEPLRRLLDLGEAGWQPVTVNDDGIELAATCTIAELYDLPEALGSSPGDARHDWPGLDLIRPCCDSFVASFKVWNMSTVGGNICTSLPAGPMISLCAGLDGMALILGPAGTSRSVPVAELITGEARNALVPGELLRSIHLPARALAGWVAFRRLSLSNLGRSGVLLIGRLDRGGAGDHGRVVFVLTVTAATKRPVQVRFNALPDAESLARALADAIPDDLYHDDVHGHPQWRKDMTYRLAEEIRMELGAPAGNPGRRGTPVSGDFRPPAPAHGGTRGRA